TAPAPVDVASGRTPKVKANDVIKIGRNRKRTASKVACSSSLPCACKSFANSTIKIALRADTPTVVNKPTWKYTSFSRPRRVAAMTAPKIPSGTTNMTENGIDQLSYNADRQRNTINSDNA